VRSRCLHPEYVYLASLELVTKRGRILPKPAKAFLQLVKAGLRAHRLAPGT